MLTTLANANFHGAFLFLLSLPAIANTLPWYGNLMAGYGHYDHMLRNDGDYAFLKLGVGKQVFSLHSIRFGIEAGVETGNTMRMDIESSLLDEIGGLPMYVKMKYMVDLQGTLLMPLGNSDFFSLLKAGIALQSWQYEHCYVNDGIHIRPQFQVGLGYNISPKATFHLSWRNIPGTRLSWLVDKNIEQIVISGIPTQNGIIFGTTLLLDG